MELAKALTTARMNVKEIIPALRYEDAAKAIKWLCDTWGFKEQFVVNGDDGRVGHAQLTLGKVMVMISSSQPETDYSKHIILPKEANSKNTQAPYVVVENPDWFYVKAVRAKAPILVDIVDQDYGGRGFTCADLEGHMWSFGSYDPRGGFAERATINKEVVIAARAAEVWEIAFDPDMYPRWGSAFAPNSRYSGKWEEGEKIVYYDADYGGCFGVLEKCEKPNKVVLRHKGLITKDKQEDVDSEGAQKWCGMRDSYVLEEEKGDDGCTVLKMELFFVHQEFKEMLEKMWDEALASMKNTVEEELSKRAAE